MSAVAIAFLIAQNSHFFCFWFPDGDRSHWLSLNQSPGYLLRSSANPLLKFCDRLSNPSAFSPQHSHSFPA
ncbi:MAG: hypothetical protein PUP91_10535 [Rhizonema sp. PD37]|nr:hypothetical protein [Rhizonema sp. PD37]